MPQNEIFLTEETEPRITKEAEGVWRFVWGPHLGLLTKDALMLPGMSFQCFNTSSLEAFSQMKEGDTIKITPKLDDVYRAWNPPEEHQVEDREYVAKIKSVMDDTTEYGIIIAQIQKEENV